MTIQRRNQAALFLYLYGLLASISFFLPLFFNPDVCSKNEVVLCLTAAAVYMLIWPFIPALPVFLILKKKYSLKAGAVVGTICLILNFLLMFQFYPEPLPQLTAVGRHSSFDDLRKASEILHDDSEPCTETCPYYVEVNRRGKLGSLRIPSLERDSLVSENGVRIPVNGRAYPGIFTVTYSPKTRLPLDIQPYDPDCGENVVRWGATIPEILKPRNNQPAVYVDKLERPFQFMKIRITKNGAVFREENYSSGGYVMSITGNERGIYTAQLFAVDVGFGAERMYAISNQAVLDLSS